MMLNILPLARINKTSMFLLTSSLIPHHCQTTCSIYDFSLLKFVKICFMAQSLVNFGKYSICFLKKFSFECRVPYRSSVLIMLFIPIFTVIFLFILLCLLLTEKGVLKLSPVVVEFFFSFYFCQILFYVFWSYFIRHKHFVYIQLPINRLLYNYEKISLFYL